MMGQMEQAVTQKVGLHLCTEVTQQTITRIVK